MTPGTTSLPSLSGDLFEREYSGSASPENVGRRGLGLSSIISLVDIILSPAGSYRSKRPSLDAQAGGSILSVNETPPVFCDSGQSTSLGRSYAFESLKSLSGVYRIAVSLHTRDSNRLTRPEPNHPRCSSSASCSVAAEPSNGREVRCSLSYMNPC